ncbi:hypothetical protein ACLOAV_004667 [Pseudogymnoascus australis]
MGGLGVEARKQERLRKKRVRALIRAGNPIPPEDQDLIPDPEAGSEPEPDSEPKPEFEPSFEFKPEPGLKPGSGYEPGFELDTGSQLARQLQHELEKDGEWERETLDSSDEDETPLGSLSLTGDWDLEQVTEFNGEGAKTLRSCVHDIIAGHARTRPDAPAICAWDAELTYSQLNEAASRLGHYLRDRTGAGAAWVPLDPLHPLQRQQQIVKQTGAVLALASPTNAARCAMLVENVVEVTPELDEKLAIDAGSDAFASVCVVSPDDAAYVLFTSGSTGAPKGLVMQHGALCTSQTAIAEGLRLTPEVRMLQFASFVFDLSIGEIFGALIVGAALCVPSEDARMNSLKEFIYASKITWAYLTPSFTRTLKPEDVPSLKLLLLAGEAVGRDLLDTWFGKLRLINAWGPAEACVFSSFHEWQSVDESPMTIGRPVAGFCWIVDPEDPYKMVPIGCVGEVVIQGPNLLREYLANPEKTAASTVTSLPDWAPRRESPFWNRFYKTGDLCSYNFDGTMEFVSRKDTQVKIRGLRVELGEVEHHMRTAIKGVRHVVVDVIKGAAGTILVSYFCLHNDLRTLSGGVGLDGKDILLPPTPELKDEMSAAAGQLSVVLPGYMVPTIFFPCRFMPSITSTKIDRGELRQMTEALSRDVLAQYSLLDSEKRAPVTPTEVKMQNLWAVILKTSPESIGRDDSFLRSGGDSITAIRLVAAAREQGMAIKVQDIFDDPRLFAVSDKVVEVSDSDMYKWDPFSLLPPGERDEILSGITGICGLSSINDTEDAYLCTSLQEGLMALAVKQPGSYIAKYVYKLPKTTKTDIFKVAWERTVELCDNLRTRIVIQSGTAIQAVIRETPAWEPTQELDLRSFMTTVESLEMQYNSRLCRYALVDDTDGERYFVLVMHHAVFDGWSLNTVLSILQRVYYGGVVEPLQSFAGFINYTKSIDQSAAAAYWRDQLDGAQRAAFPPTDHLSSGRAASRTSKMTLSFPPHEDTSVTRATILRAAWAIVLARYCETSDICFGTTVSGRHAPVFGVERMAGPTIATVPVRVRLNEQQVVSSFLQEIQRQASDMVTYEHFGLQNIAQLGENAKQACDFSSRFVVQPLEQIASMGGSEQSILVPAGEQELDGYFSHPLVAHGIIIGDRVDLDFTYHTNVITEEQLTAFTKQFEHVVQQLCEHEETNLGSVSVSGPWDVRKAIEWNSEDPEIVEACVHQLIEAQAVRRPNAPAVCAWDGELTYEQLDRASNRVANLLVDSFGTKPGDLIHVCFEKSAWFTVAILGINKAGAAWVPLDPSHPAQRQQQIVQQTRASTVICSPTNEAGCLSLVANVIVLSSDLDSKLQEFAESSARPPACDISPHNAAYVLFTSGSTGMPKGFVMEHVALCTSQTAIRKRLGLTQDVRMLQFAAHVFDICVGEIFCSLISGACICIPSEHSRLNSPKEFIRDTRVNWAFLTSTVAGTLTPDEIPGLEVMMLSGELITRDVFERWVGKVRFFSGWGPAETCVVSTLHECRSTSDSPQTIGTPVGARCWVVDPQDPLRPAPIGCVGELVVQGPTLLREYLSDSAKTEAATVL